MHNETQIGARLAAIFSLTGKVAVITGAAQGLGRQTARLFAEVGAQVVIADLNLEAAKVAAAEIQAKGGIAIGLTVNVANPVSIAALFADVSSRFGQVDILVNNAANRAKAEFFDMSVEQWDAMQEITLRGAGRIPLGRIADPMEVAQAVLFLASPAASYVTGQILAADGGYMVS